MSNPTRHYHFVGICGTAMGAVAAALKHNGCGVSGSDENVYPPMSTFLGSRGIPIQKGFRADNIPADVDVVVIGNAISRGNEEAEAVLDRKLLYQSLPEVLKNEFLRGRRNLVVTGTHGKTTTTSILAWLLESAGKSPCFMIGGIPKNFGEGARFHDSPFVVLEGDEYDCAFFDKRSKFVHYLPEIAIINNIEFDHADIYDSLDEIKLSFRRFLNIVPRKGVAFVNGDDPNVLDVAKTAPSPVVTVGLGSNCERRITDIRYAAGESRFSLAGETYVLPMDGEFNIRNAAMAISAAGAAGLDIEEIRSGLSAFQGIARRQELRGEERGVKVIDDFGHHPSAIKEALTALRRRYPGGQLWALFEPRSNTSQRNIFQKDLPAAFASADAVVLAPLHRPEKVPMEERLDIERVLKDIRDTGTDAWQEESTAAIVKRVIDDVGEGDVIVVLSNGGFDGIHDKLLEALKTS